MSPGLLAPAERKIAWAAFATLATLIASHSILETARDALFLASIPARQLPVLYILIAVASVFVTALGDRLSGGRGPRTLTTLLVIAAAATLGLSGVLHQAPVTGVYLLYVWTGVQTSVVLLQLWSLLGGLFTVVQAKSVYGFIGTGSVVGAIVGSGIARSVTQVLPAESLLSIAGGMLVLSAAASMRFINLEPTPAQAEVADNHSLMDCARYVFEQRYARRVAGAALLSAMTVTVVDYLFKSAVAEQVPADQLGTFFATVYLGLNTGSLMLQLLAVGWVVRRFNLSGALSVLPVLVVAGGITMLIAPSALLLYFSLGLKSVDGVLRHTLHRTASELLFVPFTAVARKRVKMFSDLVGQKGGQAISSVVLLGMGALGFDGAALYLLVVLALLWVVVIMSVRAPYLSLMRSQLRQEAQSGPLPELDMHSLESMVAVLDSDNGQEVVAAMSMLEQDGKQNLIPALILHHPDEEVVLHALELFARAGRRQALPVVQRIAGDRSDRVRAAALRAKHALGAPCEPDMMRSECQQCDTAVAGSRLTALLASGQATSAERDKLLNLAQAGPEWLQLSLAQDVRVFSSEHVTPLVEVLLRSGSIEVCRSVLSAMDAKRFADRRPLLLTAVLDERTRKVAQRLIAGLGPDGEALIRMGLADPSQPTALRRHLPHAATLLPPDRAADLLQGWLEHEEDGYLRYWIVRSLNRVKERAPKVKLDKAALEAQARHTIGRAYRYLGRRVILNKATGAVRETRSFKLLLRLLHDKEQQCVGRVFLLLNLTRDQEDFGNLWRNLRSRDADTRAAALELLDNALPEPLRSALHGLVVEIPDRARLAYGRSFHPYQERSYAEVLDELDASQSLSARELTECHRRELVGLVEEAEPIGSALIAEPAHAG